MSLYSRDLSMIDLGDASNENERLVLRLIRSMEEGDLGVTVDVVCSDDFSWANSGLKTINGKEALQKHMQSGGFASEIPVLRTMSHFSADLVHIASRDGVVFTERVDHHWDAEGRDLMTPHICGIAEIQDGKITAFRDFYDVACYQQEPTEPDPKFALT
jgi:limonene-1,2-epoxide hydrolase